MNKPFPYPKAKKVVPLGNHHIRVTYEDESIYDYDVNPDIARLKAFKKLSDEKEFQKVYLTRNGMSIAWGDGDEFTDPDMDVEVPYTEGMKVS